MALTADKRWRILSSGRDEAAALARQTGLTRVAAEVLWNRGITTPDAMRAFTMPALRDLHEPSLLPAMTQAAARIREAVEHNEPIVVYGDYDVDGITATAILIRCLRLLGVEPAYYIPHRAQEGYGLNADAVRTLARAGTRLLITVDCGINAVAELALAKKLGMDVIVTDHHEPGDLVPAAACLINPKLPACRYPFRDLSGAGVAFKLAWAIGKSFSARARVSPEFKEFLLDSITLAGLGTIADVVPLHGENRVIARFGLVGLGNSQAAGIRALCEAAGITTPALSAFDVAFKLAPRLNAAGRLGCARKCVELLTTDSDERARAIARELNRENTRRQKLQERTLDAAREMLTADGATDTRLTIVLASEQWHAGVVGIVASRLAAEYWKPAVLLAIEGDAVRGSARSIPPLNLFETLQDCADHLTGFGGHAMAAGLRLPRSQLAAFTEAFECAVAARLAGYDLAPTLDVDLEVELAEMTRALMGELESFAPFGAENPEPILAAYNLALPGQVRRMGSGGRHMSFWVRQNGEALRAVAFDMGEQAEPLAESGVCSLAFVPRMNRYRGRENVELDVRDLRIGAAGKPPAVKRRDHP